MDKVPHKGEVVKETYLNRKTDGSKVPRVKLRLHPVRDFAHNTAQGCSRMLGQNPASRNTMILALLACTEVSVRTRARRFLSGLSADELQFLAEFMGACILESAGDTVSALAAVQ